MFGSSPVFIAREALAIVGAESNIESLDEPTTEAKLCKIYYEPTRLRLLEMLDWPFARCEKALSLHEEAAGQQWQFRYALPSDIVAPRRVLNPLGPKFERPAFEVSLSPVDANEQTLQCDIEDAVLVYTKNATQTNLFSPLFQLSFVHLLAYNISFPLTGKNDIQDRMLERFRFFYGKAGSEIGKQETPREERDPEWITER